jgi:hypothetical protein
MPSSNLSHLHPKQTARSLCLDPSHMPSTLVPGSHMLACAGCRPSALLLYFTYNCVQNSEKRRPLQAVTALEQPEAKLAKQGPLRAAAFATLHAVAMRDGQLQVGRWGPESRG